MALSDWECGHYENEQEVDIIVGKHLSDWDVVAMHVPVYLN